MHTDINYLELTCKQQAGYTDRSVHLPTMIIVTDCLCISVESDFLLENTLIKEKGFCVIHLSLQWIHKIKIL